MANKNITKQRQAKGTTFRTRCFFLCCVKRIFMFLKILFPNVYCIYVADALQLTWCQCQLRSRLVCFWSFTSAQHSSAPSVVYMSTGSYMETIERHCVRSTFLLPPTSATRCQLVQADARRMATVSFSTTELRWITSQSVSSTTIHQYTPPSNRAAFSLP